MSLEKGCRQREEMRLTSRSMQAATSTVGFTLLLQHERGFNKVQLLFRASEENRDLQEAQKYVKTPRSGNNPAFSGVYNNSSRELSRHGPTSFQST